MNQPKRNLPVIIVGAGPVGLAAAAHLVSRGQSVLVLEAGATIAANLETYRQVSLFSRWRHNIDPVAAELLAAQGWRHPDPDLFPTAGEIIDDYLVHLAGHAAIRPHVKLEHRVTDIARLGYDKIRTDGREAAPFVVRALAPGGLQEFHGSAIIDVAGTWSQPNPLGALGVAAIGESECRAHIHYGMPDLLGADRSRYAGKRVLVVGAGHSAVGNLLALGQLKKECPATGIVWAIRAPDPARVFGNVNASEPSIRGRLGIRLKALCDAGQVELHARMRLHSMRPQAGRIELTGEPVSGAVPRIADIDEIIVATGSRPDLGMTRELRTRHDPMIESPEALAPLIDPNIHSCGLVRALTHLDMLHPEQDYFAIGAKSYGRAPNFLMVTGYEQVRVVVEALLPGTGRAAAAAGGATADACAATQANCAA